MGYSTEFPKSIKKSLRQLATVAYEREMARELEEIAFSFDAWRAGKIDVWELSRRIHIYHDKTESELHTLYETSWTDMAVAYALHRGILVQNDVPPEVWPHLERQLYFYQSMESRSQSKPAPAQEHQP